MSIDDLLGRLQDAEEEFLRREILAPVLVGHAVTVRIEGVVCELGIDDPEFQGWAVLQPESLDRARIVRPATLAETAAFLGLFPRVQLVALGRRRRAWAGVPANRGDSRFELSGPVIVRLASDEVQPFDTIQARFDGRTFWFERRDSRRNPALAEYLRVSFAESVAPEAIHKSGLSAEERDAYRLVIEHAREVERKEREADAAEKKEFLGLRVTEALEHAGARLVSFVERSDTVTVRYRVDGSEFSGTVQKDDLTVLTSGVCLDGRDRDFDLTSLVGVMREGRDGGEFY